MGALAWIKRNLQHIIRLTAIVVISASTGMALALATKSNQQQTTTTPESPDIANDLPLNPPKVELKLFAKGLTDITGIVSKSGDQKLYVISRSGTVKTVDPQGNVDDKPFLNISDRVLAEDEMGLLGLAFSPKFDEDSYLFVNYVNRQRSTVIARFEVNDAGQAVADSEQIVLSFSQPFANHNGGDLVFGPDGYLYIASGDGGSRGDPSDRGQDLNTLLGKILRIDVGKLPYSVPSSNPFVGQANKKDEIWAWGLRNPWRISFDSQTGDLFIADVGQNAVEEINFQPASSKGGENYGWRCYEASREYNTDGCGAKKNYIFPAIEYLQTEDRCSVTGGYVYRGNSYPSLEGKYFYGDFCGGQIYWATASDGTWKTEQAIKTKYQVSTFGQDSRGELFLADFANGNIYQIIDKAN